MASQDGYWCIGIQEMNKDFCTSRIHYEAYFIKRSKI